MPIRSESLEPRTLLATTIPFPDPATIPINKIAVQSDNKIVLAGSIGTTGSEDFFLARLNANGTLDTTFGNQGTVRTDFGSDDAANAVAIDSQGRIVAAGEGGPKHDFAVARYLSNGQLDTTFAHSGQRLIPFGGDDEARALVIQSDDKIILSGRRDLPDRTNRAVPIVRLNSDGSYDTTFAHTGQELLTLTDENPDYEADLVWDMAIASDGKILLVGDYFDGYEVNEAFVGRLLANGSVDETFGQAGTVQLDIHDDTDGVAIAETSPGVIVAASDEFYYRPDVAGLFSITNNGATVTDLDYSGGDIITDILPQSDRKFVVSAWEEFTDPDTRENETFFSLARFNPVSADGSATPDASFGNSGIVQNQNFSFVPLASATLDGQGRIVVAGGYGPNVARLMSTGQLDATFGNNGFARAGSATITGRVFNDANANGIFDNTDTGISNFRVFLDEYPFNGQLDPTEFSTPVSGTGTFHFNNVPAGEYHVEEVARPGWRQTFPAAGYYDVTLAASQTAKNLTFANTDTALIKGAVFFDANKNHKQDVGEPGLSNWYVYIDTNNDNLFDKGDAYTRTDPNGNYRFADLSPGTYAVKVAPQSNYTQTAPAAGSFTLTLTAGQTTSHKNFGEKRHA